MSTISRPIIMGIAKGLTVKKLSVFILSLKKTGYSGDICLFIDDMDPETLEFLHQHGVLLQPLPKRYFVQTRRFFIRFVSELLPAKFRQGARIDLSPYYHHLINARWPCYYQFLRATRGLYSHVMFTDVTDVVFQRNPFDFEWKAPFCSFYEPPGALIKDNSNNIGWIRQGYGAQEAERMKNHRIICAGVSFAEIDAAFEYLEIMCTHLNTTNCRGIIDQGIHNYILHHKLLESFYLYDYPETPVLHLALMPPEKIAMNEQGLLVNGSGQIVNAVHQYLYHMQAMSKCLNLVAT